MRFFFETWGSFSRTRMIACYSSSRGTHIASDLGNTRPHLREAQKGGSLHDRVTVRPLHADTQSFWVTPVLLLTIVQGKIKNAARTPPGVAAFTVASSTHPEKHQTRGRVVLRQYDSLACPLPPPNITNYFRRRCRPASTLNPTQSTHHQPKVYRALFRYQLRRCGDPSFSMATDAHEREKTSAAESSTQSGAEQKTFRDTKKSSIKETPPPPPPMLTM